MIEEDIDMNGHRIIDLPNPTIDSEPVTNGYADTHYSGGGGSKGDLVPQGPRGPKGDKGDTGLKVVPGRKDRKVIKVIPGRKDLEDRKVQMEILVVGVLRKVLKVIRVTPDLEVQKVIRVTPVLKDRRVIKGTKVIQTQKATKVIQDPKAIPDRGDQEVLKVTKAILVLEDYPTLVLQCRGTLI